ncbi:MAG: sortase [Clostridia bacterium]|nr:sortase [Clostridia bacterium]
MKNRKGNLLMTLGLVLILAALALVGYNQWDASCAQQESDDALMALEQIRIQRQMESQQTAAPPVVTATMMPTDTPATDAPITDAPTADATAADTPASSTPSVTDALTTDIPRDDATATNTPVTDAPATANPATNPLKPTNVPTAGTATNPPKPTSAPTAGTATNSPKPTSAPTATNSPKPTSAQTAGTATNPPKPTSAPTAGTATNPPKPTNTPTAGTATNPPKPTSTPDAAQTSNPTSTPEITETPMPTESTEPTETPEPTPSPEPTSTPTPAPTGKLYERVPGIEMPGEKVNGHEYIGTLSIPSLGLKVPVQRNWSYENLSVSPCRYSGSAYAGNLAIIAHTYHFGKLSSLALDATITFTDMENNVFRYVVREKNTISPNDANEIAHSDYDLTLVTCTLSGTKRVAVYCERVK